MIKVGNYKTVDGRDVVINEVFGDYAYGRIIGEIGPWLPSSWFAQDGIAVNASSKSNLVIPKRKLLAYRCTTKTKGVVGGYYYWWIPGSMMMVESEDELKLTGDPANWERVPEMDVEVKS